MPKKTKAMLEEEIVVLKKQVLQYHQYSEQRTTLLESVYDYLETLHKQLIDATNSLGGVIEIHKSHGAPTNPIEKIDD